MRNFKPFANQKGFSLLESVVMVSIVACAVYVGLTLKTTFMQKSVGTVRSIVVQGIVNSLAGKLQSRSSYYPNITQASQPGAYVLCFDDAGVQTPIGTSEVDAVVSYSITDHSTPSGICVNNGKSNLNFEVHLLHDPADLNRINLYLIYLKKENSNEKFYRNSHVSFNVPAS